MSAKTCDGKPEIEWSTIRGWCQSIHFYFIFLSLLLAASRLFPSLLHFFSLLLCRDNGAFIVATPHAPGKWRNRQSPVTLRHAQSPCRRTGLRPALYIRIRLRDRTVRARTS